MSKNTKNIGLALITQSNNSQNVPSALTGITSINGDPYPLVQYLYAYHVNNSILSVNYLQPVLFDSFEGQGLTYNINTGQFGIQATGFYFVTIYYHSSSGQGNQLRLFKNGADMGRQYGLSTKIDIQFFNFPLDRIEQDYDATNSFPVMLNAGDVITVVNTSYAGVTQNFGVIVGTDQVFGGEPAISCSIIRIA